MKYKDYEAIHRADSGDSHLTVVKWKSGDLTVEIGHGSGSVAINITPSDATRLIELLEKVAE